MRVTSEIIVKATRGALITLALLVVFYAQLKAQSVADSTTSKKHRKLKILPVPAFGYTPETGTYLGAVSLFTLNFYNDSATRESNAKLEFNYTWKKQMIIEAGWNYFFRKEKWYTQGLLHYSRFPDLYFGIGEMTLDSSKQRYQSDRINIDLNMLKNLGSSVFVGPRFRYKRFFAISYDKPQYPELSDAASLGLGFTGLKDSRNNLLNASSGEYLECSNVYNFSNKGYLKTYLDARKYAVVYRGMVVALRFYNEFTFGTPPFYDYSLVGGDKLVRGYYLGRYRDKNLSTLQGEVRSKIIWRFGAVLFGGVTKIYPDLERVSLNGLKPNCGLGLRFLIDRKSNINLRIDYAMAKGQDGFYISFGESF